jgi:N-acetylmuramoyl-L-alanine amidase
MKNIKYIVVHCTATPPTATLEDVRKNWQQKQQHGILQAHPYIIKRDGEVKKLHCFSSKSVIENNTLAPADECLHIAYMGGIDKEGKPVDNRTQRQEDAMFDKLVELSEKYPDSFIMGYDEFTGLQNNSPCFDVKKWLANYKPDFLELCYETEQAA